MDSDADGRQSWAKALQYSAIGLEIGLAPAVGYGLGWWLDRVFHTAPVFTVAMVLAGIAAGFKVIYRVYREMKASAEDDAEQANEQRDDSD